MGMEVLAMERKQKRQVSDLPLLYIAQPDFKTVKQQMQQTFVIKKDVKENENHIKQQGDETLATNEKEASIESQEPVAFHKGAVQEQTEAAQESTMEAQEETIHRIAVEYQETEAVHQAVVGEQEQAEEAQEGTMEPQEEEIRGITVEYQETEAAHQAVVEEQEQAEEAQEESAAIHNDVAEDKQTKMESEEEAEAIHENAVKVEGHAEEEQEITNEPEMNHEEPVKNKWQAMSFREMNNEEKIDYLLNRPHYIPEIRCYIRTKQSSYIGYIKSYEDGIIKIKAPAKLKDVMIDIKDILSIQMIGT
jgi:hypothetical protein